MVQNAVTIYGLLFLCWVLSSPSRLLHRRALFPLHIRIDPQTQRQMLSGVQLHQRLQNLGVHMFRRLVRPNILSSENISYAKRAAPEFVCSIRLGRHIRALTHSQFRNIAFVNVQPYAQNGIAAIIITGESNCVETLSPLCRSFRRITPLIGARM